MQADVGLGRGDDRRIFLSDKPRPIALDPIDENNSLRVGSPLKSNATVMIPTPRYGPSRTPASENRADNANEITSSSSKRSPVFSPDNWTRGELIGQGAFGSVYLGMNNETGQLMAVKTVGLTHAGSASSAKLAEHLKSLEAEVSVLQGLDHPNIVRYLGIQRATDALHIFLEYVPGGSIASLLAKFGSFRESVVKVYTKQILLGLDYLHAHGIIHRDIKGANILVDNTGLVKLADFGASKKIEDVATIGSGYTSVKGTPYWMAPEVITQAGHGRQADIWSVACTVIEMATGKPPWSQYGSQVSAMFHIAKSKGPPLIPEHLSPDCKDFLYLCFNRNWRERPSASKLLQHPFLEGIVCRTAAAPLNNIAAPEAQAIMVEMSGTNGGTDDIRSRQMSSPSIPERRSVQQRSPTKTSTSGAQHSPSKTSQNTRSGVPKPQMSPLAHHYPHNESEKEKSRGTANIGGYNPQDGVRGRNEGSKARRHLEMDVAATYLEIRSSERLDSANRSPAKQPAVRASAPALAVWGDDKASQQRQNPTTAPRVGDRTTSEHNLASINPPLSKHDQCENFDEEERMRHLKRSAAEVIEATLMIPSVSKTPYSTPMVQQIPYDRRNDNVAAAHSGSVPEDDASRSRNPRSTMSIVDPSTGSIPQTIALTGSKIIDPSMMLRNSDASSSRSESSRPNSAFDRDRLGSSVDASNASKSSMPSEFNPMEEPMWAGSLDDINALTSSGDDIKKGTSAEKRSRLSSSCQDMGRSTKANGVVEETSSTPVGDVGKRCVPSLRLSEMNDAKRLLSSSRGIEKEEKSSGRMERRMIDSSSTLSFSSLSSASEASERTRGGSRRQSPSHVDMQRSHASSITTGRGPIVYTVEGDKHVESLPWDVDITDMHGDGPIPSSEAPHVSVAFERGGQQMGKGNGLRSLGGADEDVLIGALMQRARHDLRMSMPAFSNITGRKVTLSSNGKGTNGNSSASSSVEMDAHASSHMNSSSQSDTILRSSSGVSSCSSSLREDCTYMRQSQRTDRQPEEVTSPARAHMLQSSRIPSASISLSPSKARRTASLHLSPSKLPIRPPSGNMLRTPAKERMVSSAGSYEAKFRAQRDAERTPSRGLYATPRKTPRKFGDVRSSASAPSELVGRTPSRRSSTPARAI